MISDNMTRIMGILNADPWSTDPQQFRSGMSQDAMRNFWRNSQYGSSVLKAKQYFNSATRKVEIVQNPLQHEIESLRARRDFNATGAPLMPVQMFSLDPIELSANSSFAVFADVTMLVTDGTDDKFDMLRSIAEQDQEDLKQNGDFS